MDLLLVAAYTKLKVAADIVPQDLYGLQLRCTAGDAGQLGLGEMFDQWRSWLRCMGPHELPPTPQSSQGATLASMGERGRQSSSSAMWVAGEPGCGCAATWHGLHRVRRPYKARVLGMLRRDV